MDDETRGRLIRTLSTIAEAIIQAAAQRADDPDDLGTVLWVPGASAERDITRSLSHYFEDPVGRALRAGIADIGRTLVPSTEYEELLTLVEAAARNTSDYDTALGALTHQWDGLKTLDGRRWTV